MFYQVFFFVESYVKFKVSDQMQPSHLMSLRSLQFHPFLVTLQAIVFFSFKGSDYRIVCKNTKYLNLKPFSGKTHFVPQIFTEYHKL